MLRVLLATFNPVNNLICCKTALILVWVVKRATSLFNSFCSIVAWQVARFFLLPVFPSLRTLLSRHLSYKRKTNQRYDFMTTEPAQLVGIPVLWCRDPGWKFSKSSRSPSSAANEPSEKRDSGQHTARTCFLQSLNKNGGSGLARSM